MGAWRFLRPHLTDILGKEPRYVGRPAAPSPAVGSHRAHKEEQEKLLAGAFEFSPSP
jgi:2-oxoglutarate dehydrogenase E1 component